jgi:hypothetical protein
LKLTTATGYSPTIFAKAALMGVLLPFVLLLSGCSKPQKQDYEVDKLTAAQIGELEKSLSRDELFAYFRWSRRHTVDHEPIPPGTTVRQAIAEEMQRKAPLSIEEYNRRNKPRREAGQRQVDELLSVSIQEKHNEGLERTHNRLMTVDVNFKNLGDTDISVVCASISIKTQGGALIPIAFNGCQRNFPARSTVVLRGNPIVVREDKPGTEELWAADVSSLSLVNDTQVMVLADGRRIDIPGIVEKGEPPIYK